MAIKQEDIVELTSGSSYTVAVGWEERATSNLDLDLCCIMFDEYGVAVEPIYYNRVWSTNKALLHSGDNMTGAGVGDDESILVNFPLISPDIHYLAFTITRYSICSDFAKHGKEKEKEKEKKAFARLYADSLKTHDLFRLRFSIHHQKHTACIFLVCVRRPTHWLGYNVSLGCNGKDFQELIPIIQDKCLRREIPHIKIKASNFDLNKIPVNLVKGENLSLFNSKNPMLPGTVITMGLGWDFIDRPIDLDASCCLFNAEGHSLEIVYYGNLKSLNDAVCHSGDNTTGQGSGDDERIEIRLDKLENQVYGIVLAVNCYSGVTFSSVSSAYVRLLSRKPNSTEDEIARFDLNCRGSHTGLVLCKLTRLVTRNGEPNWAVQAIGEPGKGRKVQDMLPLIQQVLQPNYHPSNVLVPLPPPKFTPKQTTPAIPTPVPISSPTPETFRSTPPPSTSSPMSAIYFVAIFFFGSVHCVNLQESC